MVNSEAKMTFAEFIGIGDNEVIEAAFDETLGYNRARAIVELVYRALDKPELLPQACRAIETDKKIGVRTGTPLGWFGADEIYLSGQERAIRFLLNAMKTWDAHDQQDLVAHWAGSRMLPKLTQELKERYGWTPRYPLDAM